MGWVRTEDTYLTHPKVLHVGRDARVFWDAARCWSSANLTDGYIPESAYKVIAANAGVGSPRKLVAVLLTHPPQYAHGLAEEAEGGFVIHDYLLYNPSSADVQAKRAAKATAGKAGGEQSGASRRSKTEANAKQNATPVPIPVPSPETSTSSEHQPEKTDNLVVPRAIVRAQSANVVALNGGSPQHALLAVAQIALGFNGQTVKERARENAAAGQLVKAGVSPDELRDLIAEWRKRGWKDPSLAGIEGNLGRLRAPYEAGRKSEQDEPRGFEGIREAFADLDPRRAS